MIEVRGLTKRFDEVVAVDGLSFDVHPGRVTGFLGPNGAGKSTTMRCMLGLDRPQSGTTTFAGRRYSEIDRPLHEVGALLDAGYVHPARKGRDHLRWLARTNGLSDTRVDEVLHVVGLTEAAARPVKGYSLGMRQRLGLAGILLGKPHTLILDEPANGLDPEGIRWIRDVLRHQANEGAAVLVSSHLLSEISMIATDLVVVGRGRLVDQGTVADFVDRNSETFVQVRSPHLAHLVDVVQAAGAVAAPLDPAAPAAGAGIRHMTVEQVGEAAAANGIVLHELLLRRDSLEDAFLRATAGAQEFRTPGPRGSGGALVPPPGRASGPVTGPPTGPPLNVPGVPPGAVPPPPAGSGGAS